MDFTVAIPTYNGAERLPAVLERLRCQTGTANLRWEVIVCDNNSNDDTAEVVRKIQQAWQQDGPKGVPLRYCFAPEQGAAFARQRAVEASLGQWIGFLDDDNFPDPDWVAQAHRFVAERPDVGVVGSQIHAQFDSEPPEEFQQIACFLAIVERGSEPHRYDDEVKVLPPGAGLVVRRDLWLDHVPRRLFLNHKGKSAGLASEDLEAVLYLRRSGCEIWYNPSQVVYHHIPDGRLQQEYLESLFRCIGFSRLYVRLLGVPSWQRPFMIPLYVANDLRRLVLHLMKQRQILEAYGEQDEEVATDLLEKCDRAYLSASLVSPIKLAKKAIVDQAQSLQERWHFPQREAWLSALAAALEADQFQLYGQMLRPLQGELAEPLSLARDEVPSPLSDISASPALVPSAPVAPTEVLLRMDPALTALVQPLPSPVEFMALAVRYKLTARIDRWVIRQILQQLGNQPSRSSPHSVPQYSINLSVASLRDDALAAFLARQLKLRGLSASCLTFELDESMVLHHYEQLSPGLQAMQELGCSFTLDNFSHQLSPQQMREFPVSYLKLHPASFRRICQQGHARHLSQLAVGGWRTVAKGIETPIALAQVTRAGLDYAQGYGVARPRPLVQCSLESMGSESQRGAMEQEPQSGEGSQGNRAIASSS